MNRKPNDLFGFIVEDLSRMMRRRFERSFNDNGTTLGITRGQARVLASVSLNAGITNTELAERLDMQKITLTHLLDFLETQNLVERRPDENDRRKKRLYVTQMASTTLDQIWQVLAEVSGDTISVLPEERAATFIDDLATVRDHMLRQSNNNKSI